METKPKTLGEKASTWAKALSILVASVLGVYGIQQGSSAKDGVSDNYKTLSVQVNKQNKVINDQSRKLEKLVRQMVFYNAHMAGVRAGKLYQQNEALMSELKSIKAKRSSRKPTQQVQSVKKVQPKKAKPSKPTVKATHIDRLTPMPQRKR